MDCAYDQKEEVIIMNEVKKWTPLLEMLSFSLGVCGLTYLIVYYIEGD